jgi:hypothetical protein
VSANPFYASWGVIWKFPDIGFSIVEVTSTTWGVKPWVGGYAYVHGAVNFDQWHYVAVVYAGNGSSSRSVFVDGTFVATDTSGTAADFTGVLTLGDRGGYTTTLRGIIDEVRVYNRALNASEIAGLASRPSTLLLSNSMQNRVNDNMKRLLTIPCSPMSQANGRSSDTTASPKAIVLFRSAARNADSEFAFSAGLLCVDALYVMRTGSRSCR